MIPRLCVLYLLYFYCVILIQIGNNVCIFISNHTYVVSKVTAYHLVNLFLGQSKVFCVNFDPGLTLPNFQVKVAETS